MIVSVKANDLPCTIVNSGECQNKSTILLNIISNVGVNCKGTSFELTMTRLLLLSDFCLVRNVNFYGGSIKGTFDEVMVHFFFSIIGNIIFKGYS